MSKFFYSQAIKQGVICALSIILILALSWSGISWDAYGSEELLSGNEIHGYVEDITFNVNQKGTNGIVEDCVFQANTKEYSLVLPDSRHMSSKINITIPDDYIDSNLHVSLLIDDVEQQLDFKKNTKIALTKKTTSDMFKQILKIQNFPAGKQTKLTVKVGPVDEDGSFVNYDSYDYLITRSLTLKTLSVSVETENLTVTPAFDSVADPYNNNFTTITDANEINLNLVSTTTEIDSTETEIWVGEEKYDAENNKYELTKYKPTPESDVACIPIKVKNGELETEYTLFVCKQDLSPVIETIDDVTTEKGSGEMLTAVVSEPTDGEGTLSYQWYRYLGSNKKIINGATESSYQPSTKYIGTEKYFCVVTYTVDGISFESTSNDINYTVISSTLTAPEILIPLQISGKDILFKGEKPSFEIGLLAASNNAPIEGVDYEISMYRNETASFEGSELIATECRSDGNTTKDEKKCNKYSVTLNDAQDVIGSYFYYAEIKVSSEGFTGDSIVSNPVQVTFKDPTDVVTGLKGSGTESDPYLIHNEDDLNYVKKLVEGEAGQPFSFSGQVLAFANNIELSETWKPIGNLKPGGKENDCGISLQPFSGTIDGKGYSLIIADYGKPLLNYARHATIKNMTIQGNHIDGYGLLDKYVVDYGETGEYQNDTVKLRTIDIENVTIKSGTKILKSGFAGGYASGVNAINIRNCLIEDGVVIGYNKDQSRIGSFCGDFNGTIENSKSYAAVYGVDYVGGLFGSKGQSIGPCTVKNSAFLGTIEASGMRVGGIAGSGYIGGASGTPVVQIHNCYVAADIKGVEEVGGIIGSEVGHVNYNDTGDDYGIKGANALSDNLFYGKLYGEKNVGAIIGCVNDFTKTKGNPTNFFLDNCGTADGIGGAVTGAIVGADKFSSPRSETELADNTVVQELNNSESSYKNWIQGEKYPVISDTPIVTSLSLGGEYKTQYIIGDDLDLNGITVSANWSDGSRTSVNLNDLQINGYNKNQHGLQTVTLKYNTAETTITVTVLKADTPENPKTINVSFTLLGDSVHDSSADKKIHTLETGGLQTWIYVKNYPVSINATVRDVFEMALGDAGYTWRNETGNYVQGITKPGTQEELAEYTNGPNSGWMYTLNGKHSALGVAEQYLENGDKIIFHYTDDYFYEPDSKDWAPPAVEEKTEVTTSKESGSVSNTTTTPTEVTVSGSTATATVTKENVTETLKQATENKASEIVLQVSADDTKGAATVKVQLDTATVKDIVEDTTAALTVKTENGTVSLDQEVLKTVAAEAAGSTVTLEIVEVKAPTAVHKEAAGENGHVIQLVIKSGNKTISAFNEGKATVTVEIPTKLHGKKVAAIHIGDDGKIEHLKGHEVTEGGKKHYRFDTPHFSTFALVDADEIGLEVEETMTAEEVKALLADLTPVARSSKTAKKNIKVTVKLDKADKAIIEELEAEGFTVKYNFYRSTKKSSKYKSRLIKDTTTYTQTGGKKGTKYYYKVRVQVYDAEGKLIARTALKQCKYANRKWTKQ